MAITAGNVCLHYVSEGTPRRRFTLSRADLARYVEMLSSTLQPACLSDYAQGRAPDESSFTLSFDDAHVSVLEHALPVLSALGATATLFVPTGYVGTSAELLDWDDLRRLRDAGWTLGSHSHAHARMGWRLYDEDDDAHLRRLVEDLSRSRDAMERALGAAPALFAYPYGEDTAIARRAVALAGFEAAFTVRGDHDWDGDLCSVPRVDFVSADASSAPTVVETPTSLSVIVPACDRAGILADVVTRLASQTYPEDRYEVIVVDDGSETDLSPIFEEMPDNVRLVRQGDGRFRAGQARQRGADEAKGAVLVFLDADVAVQPDFLWHVDWVHRREPDAVLLGYLSGYNLHDLGHLHTPADVIGKDLDALAIIPDRSREPTLRGCLDNLDWLEAPWPLTYTGNLSLPKALLQRIGGFDSTFVGWGLEDVDLGIRLHKGGARFLFSRFAVGYHVVDPDEGPSRNPFREPRPDKARFSGYLENLENLGRRHAADPAIMQYILHSREDIEETCARPMTVGIELGGEASVRNRYHKRLHQVQPGGVPAHELFDRVAYAKKIGARTIYLLGGAPAEHPAFLDAVQAASLAVSWVSMQTLAYPFARPGLAEEARRRGLRGAIVVVHSLSQEPYEALHGDGTFAAFRDGMDALRTQDLELAVHLVVSEETRADLEETVSALAREGLGIEEVSVTRRELIAEVRRVTGREPALLRGRSAPVLVR